MTTKRTSLGATPLSFLDGSYLLIGRIDPDNTSRGIDDDRLTVTQRLRIGRGDHSDDASGTSKNRGMARRTALRSHNTKHLPHIEGGGLRRRQITCHQYEGFIAAWNSRGLDAEHIGDHLLTDAVQIRCTLGHIATKRRKTLLEIAESFIYGPFSGLARCEMGGDGIQQGWIGGHLAKRPEDGSSFPLAFVLGAIGTLLQIITNPTQCTFGALQLRIHSERCRPRLVSGFRQRIRHRQHGADRNTPTDTHTMNHHMLSFHRQSRSSGLARTTHAIACKASVNIFSIHDDTPHCNWCKRFLIYCISMLYSSSVAHRNVAARRKGVLS